MMMTSHCERLLEGSSRLWDRTQRSCVILSLQNSPKTRRWQCANIWGLSPQSQPPNYVLRCRVRRLKRRRLSSGGTLAQTSVPSSSAATAAVVVSGFLGGGSGGFMAGRGLPVGGCGWAGGRVGSSCIVATPPPGLLNAASELSVDLPQKHSAPCTHLEWVSKIWRPTRHITGHFGDDVLQVRWPNQQCQSTEGGWLVIQIALNLTRLISTCYNNTTCMHIQDNDTQRNLSTVSESSEMKQNLVD